MPVIKNFNLKKGYIFLVLGQSESIDPKYYMSLAMLLVTLQNFP